MENNKMMCEICSSEFTPEEIGKNHYIARDNVVIGLAAITKTTEHKLYDAFDCPVCKCQNIIGERKRSNAIIDIKETEDNEDESEDDCECTEELPECFRCYNDKIPSCSECKVKNKCEKESEKILYSCFGKYEKVCSSNNCKHREECKTECYKAEKPECYGTEKIEPECWECFYKWGCIKKLGYHKTEKPKCYGEYINNDFCNCCEYAKECSEED